jgi:hypothetical protein
MVARQLDKNNYLWVFLLVLVLGSNLILYRSPLSTIVLSEETKWLILGSLIDLAIVSPFLVIVVSRKKNHLLNTLSF